MKRIFRTALISCMPTGLLLAAGHATANAPIAADVIVVIDESGSMSGEQNWIAESIPLLEENLKLYGIGSESQANEYGLVGFGNSQVVPRTLQVDGDYLGTSEGFVSAAGNLVVNGGTEDGWRGIEYALDEYPRRNGAAVNIILATDEDRDNTKSSITYSTVLQKLDDNRALLNAVINARIRCGDGSPALGVDSQGTGYVADGSGGFTTCEGAYATQGYGGTVSHYVDLAMQNGGAAWDLQFLRSGGTNAQSFTRAFLDIKVDEILSQRPVGDLVAVAQATPNPAVAGQSVQLDGAGSYHQKTDREIVSWEWDLDNDGTYDASGPVIGTSFPALGEYPVTLRITDDSDTPLSATTTVVVNVNTPPLTPTADAGGPYLFCPQSQPWFMDGSDSVNPDDGLSEPGQPVDSLTALEWDLDDDLAFDDAQGALIDVTQHFTGLGVGDYLVRLRATDNTANAFPSSGQPNLSDTAFAQVRVRDAADSQCNCLTDLAARTKMTKVQLTWGDSGAYEYAIYRSLQQGGPYERIAVTDSRYSTYLDLGLEQDTTYYYVVSELARSGQEVCRSQEINVTPTVRRPNPGNRAPVIDSTPITSATEGQLYQYDVDASDPDPRERLTYTLKLAPTGMTINADTGLVEWTPVNAQVGTQTVIVQVADNQGAVDEQSFEVQVANVNQPPVITSTPVTAAVELQAYAYALVTLDPDLSDALTYSLSAAPSGMVIDTGTGLIEWTPAEGQAGAHSVTVTVTDSAGLGDQQSFTIDVEERNHLPVIGSIPPTSATANSLYQYDVDATDANVGDPLTYALGTFPEGMTIDPASGLINWTPTDTQVGVHDTSVVVSDDRGGSTSQTFQITVEEENLAPVFSTTSLPDATEDLSYSATLTATDPNSGDTLTFSLEDGPANLSVDAQTGELTWLPVNAQVGSNSITVRVTDADGLFNEATLSIVVQNVNDSPTFSSQPPLTATEGVEYQYAAQAEDPDAGDSLTYALVAAPEGMAIDATSGWVTWIPTSNQGGSHAVTVRAIDTAGAAVEQSFSVSVQILNQPPVITSSAPTAAFADQTYQYPVTATDPENDSLTFILTQSPTGMTVAAATGLIEWQPTLAQLGDHEVAVQVTDIQGGTDIQSYTLTVTDPNQPPVIQSSPVVQATATQAYVYNVVAVDPDGGPISYSLDTAPAGMTLDASTGELNWTPTEGQVGTHVIRIVATDENGAQATQEFSLEVLPKPNTAPVIQSQPFTSAKVDAVYQYSVSATDADNDPLAFSLDEAPAGMSIEPAGGVISWTPTSAQLGAQSVVVRVSDGQGGSATQSFSIQVAEDNAAPSITSTPLVQAEVGTAYSYDVEAIDPEMDALTFSLIVAPSGMVIDAASGVINWIPQSAHIGDVDVTVSVDDGKGGSASQSYTITVISGNEAPVITSTPLTQATVGVLYGYDVNATDADGDALTYDLANAPSGMMIDNASGMIEWTPGTAQTGSHSVSVEVSDAEFTITQLFNVEVSEPAELSVSMTLSATIVNPNDVVTVSVEALNATNPTYQLTVDGQSLPIDSLGSATYSNATPGIYHLVAEVQDASGTSGTATAILRVRDAADNQPPVVSITTPTDGTELLDAVDVLGSVTDDNLYRYQIHMVDPGNTNQVLMADGSVPVNNGVLGSVDPAMLENGLYRLVLTAEDLNGLISQDIVDVRVEGALKPGVVQLSFVDMTVPVAGIPVVIERQYDSRIKNKRDFGVGWSLSVRQGEYENNREPGEGWAVQSSGGFFNIPCYSATEQVYHLTDIRLAENESYQFRPTIQLNGFGSIISGGCLGQASFVQMGGAPGATLQPIGNNNVFYSNGSGVFTYDLGDTRFGDPWVPENVRLTTPDGRVFDLNIENGISRLENTSGDQLFISNSGVVNASGRGVSFSRDSEGRIESIQDPLGNTVQYQYGAYGNLTVFINQLSQSTTYQYHPEPFENHLKSITLPDGTVLSSLEYDQDGRLSEACDEDGCTRAEYDLVGRTQTTFDAMNRATTYVYDAEGNVISETDALGNTHTYAYDANGNLTEHTDPEGNVTLQEWDAQGNLLSVVEPHETGADPADYTTTYSYDSQGNLLTAQGPGGIVLQQSYDASGNLTSMTDENGFVLAERTYDTNGRPLTETDPFGTLSYAYGSNGLLTSLTDDQGTTSFGHDAAGNITSYTRDGVTATFDYDAMGRETTLDLSNGISFSYDYQLGGDWSSAEGTTIPRVERTFTAKGAPESIEQADGSTVEWEYDASGLVTAETDAAGSRTEYYYDAAGRLASERDPLGHLTHYERDGNGRVTAIIDAEGSRVEFSYYPDGRQKTMTDAEGGTWSYVYTPKEVSVTDPLNRTMTTESNGHGLVTRIVNADGTDRSWTYLVPTEQLDGGDLPTSFTDEAGRTRQFGYDASGRLTSAGDFAGAETTYAYGDDGISQIEDPLQQIIDFTYDAFGEVSAVTFADGTQKQIGFDAARNVATVSLSSGDVKTFTYDDQNRVTNDSRSSGVSYSYGWGPGGNLLTSTDELGTAQYDYDSAGRITQYTSSTGESIVYVYDQVGRITGQTITNADGSQQQTIGYQYDGTGRLTTLVDPNGQETTFVYDEAGRLTDKTLPNGVSTEYQYDTRDQVTAVIHRSAGGSVISSVQYQRAVGGEPTRISWQDGSYVDLTYDAALRISDERFYTAGGVLTHHLTYEYDAVGNRTARIVDGERMDYTYQAGNRLVSASDSLENQTYGYDANGRVDQIDRNGLDAGLTYNFDGQIRSATVGGTTTTYRYDGSGRRIEASTSDGAVRRFLKAASPNGVYENPQAIVDDQSNIVQTYVYAGDQPVQRLAGGDTYYYLTDGMGSVIGITDQAGNLVGSVKYDAFGRELDLSGNMSLPGSAGGDFRFHGQWKEAATGLYDLRARDYDPETGRFLAADPAEPDYYEPESLNRYLFANANPYVNSDPSGRFTLVSVNISINIQATLRSIAVNIAKDYLIDKARSVVGSLVASQLKNFTALSSFNPWGFIGVDNPGKAGQIWEQKVQNLICSVVPDVMRDVVWFEPAISGGYAFNNGYGCPGGGGNFAPPGYKKPDFILSKTEPKDLGKKGHERIKAYLIGETKLSLKTFYNAYVKNGGYNREQFDEIIQFADDRVYTKTAIFLALYAGKGSHQASLSKLLNAKAVSKGVIPIMVSGF